MPALRAVRCYDVCNRKRYVEDANTTAMSKTDAIPLNIVTRKDLTPQCCHCSMQLTEVCTKSKGSGFVEGRNQVYFCPHCLKVPGFGQSRMH